MSIGITVAFLALASVVAVPAVLRAYSQVVKRRYKGRNGERNASLERVRRVERLWFRVSPFVLIAAAAIALYSAYKVR